ncbi:glycoside hydrolase family 125 protein [Reichenbachiella sp.]|uniref:glycoside hydrolase family 125 protein n=1 Tax=Reichenbachiella sp. TaxID=2184521 RepID=UPI003296BE63
MDRRNFIIKSSILSGVTTMIGPHVSFSRPAEYVSKRPAKADRKFTSKAVEKVIREVKKAIGNEELAWMFENCFPNTLDTTVKFKVENEKPDAFIITGDIDAMWLRDSTAQVWPYLRLVNKDNELKELVRGLIFRQSKLIQIDPYANAFNDGPLGSKWESDNTEMKPELHERKWEIDSLCYPIRLAYHYWKTTNDKSCFDQDWVLAMQSILRTFKEQQRKENRGPYSFTRRASKASETLIENGFGNPVKPVGLIVSSFRPSDDATILPFLIPSNHFALVSLRQLSEIATEAIGDDQLALNAESLADEVEEALMQFGYGNHPDFGKILAYEADGFGNVLFMDDANIPSLLALPYLGAMAADDPIYQNTRKFLLSQSNPWFFKGKHAEGIGGPHVGADMVWPMSIIMRALTSADNEEIMTCLKMLIATHAGTGFMHESFHKDDPAQYTRDWFAWANTLFGELVYKIYRERPELLKKV